MILGAIAVGYAGSGVGAGRLVKKYRSRRSLNGKLNYQVFAALVGQSFTVTQPKSPEKYRARMQLVEAETVFLSAENDQFYLIFELDGDQVQPNGVCRIHHATAGSTQLYLQSTGNDLPGNYCRAEFNLLL